GPNPPDLDELIRKGQDSLKSILPGGAGGRSTWVIIVLAILALITFNSIYQVQADERGVVLRLGSYVRTVTPGLHFAIWPVETLEAVRVEAENQTPIGATANEGLMLAGDQNLVDIRFTVLWKIKNPEEYLFNVSDQEKLVRVVAESAMREIVGRTPAEEVRTTGRLAAQDQVMNITQTTLDSYSAGILITGVKLEKADPPAEVLGAFEEVQRAEQDQARLINEADQYANQRRRLVEGEAAKVIEDAKGYKARVTLEAQGEAQRFLSVYEQYKNAKDVTRRRIFLETLEDILAQSSKVIIEGGEGQGVVPYLPLPEIQKRQNTTPPAQGANQ
ncbi:MAG: FtsH protease activity modulator HflK, partial [Parvibaculaceae bacterium]